MSERPDRPASAPPSAGTPWASIKGALAHRSDSPRSQSLMLTAARVVAGVLAIGVPLVLVRVLDQAVYGIYKQLFLVALTLHPFLGMGLPASLYFLVPREPESASRYQMQTFLMLSAAGLFGAVIVLFGSDGIARFFDAPLQSLLPWIALYVALAVPGSLIPVAPMVDRRARLAAVLVVVGDIGRAAVLISVALISGRLEPVIVAACVMMAAQLAAAAAYVLAAHRRAPTMATVRSQLSYAFPFATASWLGVLRDRLHAFYMGNAFSEAQFAIYAAATINLPLIGKLSETVGEVVVLENAGHHSEGRVDQLRRVWHRATRLLSLVLFPVWAIAEVFADGLIDLLYTSGYSEATPIFRIFLFTIPLSVFLGSPMLRASRDLKQMVVADAAALIAVIGVLVLFTPHFGPLAAVASLVVGKSVYMGLAAGRTASRLGLTVRSLMPWGTLAAIAGVSFGAAAAGWLAAEASGWGIRPRLFVGGASASAIYVLTAWGTGLLPRTEKDWLLARFPALGGRRRD